MRSAFAEVAFRREANGLGLPVDVVSAGTNARPGKSADPRATTRAQVHGFSLESHRARLLDSRLIESADIIVAMDYLNAARILTRFPDAAPRLVMLGHFRDREHDGLEISDPYDQPESLAMACFDRIADSVAALARTLDRRHGP